MRVGLRVRKQQRFFWLIVIGLYGSTADSLKCVKIWMSYRKKISCSSLGLTKICSLILYTSNSQESNPTGNIPILTLTRAWIPLHCEAASYKFKFDLACYRQLLLTKKRNIFCGTTLADRKIFFPLLLCLYLAQIPPVSDLIDRSTEVHVVDINTVGVLVKLYPSP